MPPYRYRYNYQRRYRKRRPYFRRWRFGKTIRRKYRTKRYRRRRKVKFKPFKFYKKKLKTIKVKQWQPKQIVKCKIKGTKCLFQGSPLRSNNNFIQTVYSYVPEYQPGGGGWTLIVQSLETLFEDYEHLQNIWTSSNAGFPLSRYLGCKMRFYQSPETDYVVTYDNCWPMVDTPLSHADAAPGFMLQKKHKIVIPSINTRRKRKPYKQIWIKPPAQMYNHWYFTKDICKTPLVLLTATACNLQLPFAKPEAKSNNISLKCLNIRLFKNTNFQHPPETTYYSPKTTDTSPPKNIYLYASHLRFEQAKINDLFPLGNTKQLQQGKTYQYITKEDDIKLENLGNPFESHFFSEDEFFLYHSTINFSQMITYKNSNEHKNATLNKLQNILPVDSKTVITVRYNPDKDTGKDNKIYLVKNYEDSKWQEPTDENLIIEGLPLYYALWGWLDWQKKLKKAVRIFNDYTLVIQTKTFDVDLPYYVLLDQDFIDGFNPYGDITDKHIAPSYYNSQNWFPKTTYQEQSIQQICDTGPFTPKTPWNHYLQARYQYTFYFKWGGCPKDLKKAYDPCLQPKWPTPDNITPATQISNPATSPSTMLYSWDWKEDYIKKKAIKRIADHTEINENVLSVTDSKYNPRPLQKKRKTQTSDSEEEKEENELLQQLLQLQKQRKHLQQLLQLTGT